MSVYEPWELFQTNLHVATTFPDTPASRMNSAFLASLERLKAAGVAYDLTDERTLEEDADGGLSAFMATRGRPSATDPSSAGVSRITPLPGDRPREERADHLQIARLESSTQRGGIWEEPRLQRGT